MAPKAEMKTGREKTCGGEESRLESFGEEEAEGRKEAPEGGGGCRRLQEEEEEQEKRGDLILLVCCCKLWFLFSGYD